MKKLLFVISQLYKGGAETSLVNLLNHLDTTKYEIELLILNQSPIEHAVSLIPQINKKINCLFKRFFHLSFLFTLDCESLC